MTSEYTDILGYAAAILTTISFIPQVIMVLKTKDTKSISLSMYSIFFFGIVLWLAYGIIISNMPIIIANVITLMLSGIILITKIRYK